METTNKKKLSTTLMVQISFMAALAWVLMLFETPGYLGFLKLELSDIPAIIAALQFGPLSGVMVELIKNILKGFATHTLGIGEVANFIVGSAYVIPLGIIYRKKRNKIGLILGFITAIISMVVVGAFMNYFVLIPIYAQAFGGIENVIAPATKTIPAITDLKTFILLGITPFNLVKGTIIAIVGYVIFNSIKHRLNEYHNKK